MKLSILISITLALFFLQSCKRDENPTETYHIYGQVVDAYSKKGVSNATVRIYTTDNMAFLRYTSWKGLAYEGKTDDSGKYDVYYQAKKEDAKGIIFFKDKYTTYDELILISSGMQNKQLAPNKFSKVNIKNLTPFNEADSIYVDVNSVTKFGLKGTSIDTSFIVEYVFNYPQKISWTVFKDGQLNKTTSYLDCTPLDTCDFKIHF